MRRRFRSSTRPSAAAFGLSALLLLSFSLLSCSSGEEAGGDEAADGEAAVHIAVPNAGKPRMEAPSKPAMPLPGPDAEVVELELPRGATKIADAHIPEMRFAGASLSYVLRRMATEANIVLIIDEYRRLRGPDIDSRMVDMDFEPGPLMVAVRKMEREIGGFRAEERPHALYIRSLGIPADDKAFDTPLTKGEIYTGNFRSLTAWIQERAPTMLVVGSRVAGTPSARNVRFEVPPGATALDFLTLFGSNLGYGIRIRRAGWVHHREGEPGGPQRIFRVNSAFEMMTPIDEPLQLPSSTQVVPFNVLGMVGKVAVENGASFGIKDFTMVTGNVPSLGFHMTLPIAHADLEPSLDALAVIPGQQKQKNYTWEKRDGAYLLKAFKYHHLEKKGLAVDWFGEELKGGTFEGSLPDLARWINTHRQKVSRYTLLGGEIDPSLPRTRIEIAAGTTIEDALLQFAKATATGWLFTHDGIVSDMTVKPPSADWDGGYLTPLESWAMHDQPVVPKGMQVRYEWPEGEEPAWVQPLREKCLAGFKSDDCARILPPSEVN